MRFFITPRDFIQAVADEAQRGGCQVVERDGRTFLIITVDCECGAASVTEIDLTAVADVLWERAA